MLLKTTPYFYSALVTIECETPLSIKSDDLDMTIDTRLVRDVNDYPLIPGTSITGVLRHVARLCKADDNQLFGHAKGQEQQPSQVQVSFGYVHNANNKPITGLDIAAIQADDAVSRCLKELMPIQRDQVALNEYGTAKHSAKMDRAAVPKGTRFSFELNWASHEKDDKKWAEILSWLSHPEFRLGGLTHRGFGKVKTHKILTKFYDFTADGIEKWLSDRKQSVFVAQSGHEQFQEMEHSELINFKLTLKAEDFWRVGQGSRALPGDYDKEPDLKPYTEEVIDWSSQSAVLKKQQVVIPASGIKGALRHRTLFHFRRLLEDFSDGISSKAHYSDLELTNLFGSVDGDNAQKGSLILDDIYDIQGITNSNGEVVNKVMMHNKIDRFTGGIIDGALFSEQLIYGGSFSIEGSIKQNNQSQELLNAFKLALLDIAEGRLALGGGSTKGHGYFQAEEVFLHELEQAIENASPHPRQPNIKEKTA